MTFPRQLARTTDRLLTLFCIDFIHCSLAATGIAADCR
jgi:hypothetical protein